MPEENKNPEEGQVQPSKEATDEALTLEQLQGKRPEEILDLYNNAIEMRKSATQKFMETSDREKRLEAEREYLLTDRQRKDEEVKRLYAQLEQVSKLNQEAGQQTQPSPRRYDELSPEQAYEQLYSEQKTTQGKIDAMKEEYEKKLQNIYGEVQKTQSSIKYEKFLEKEIFPKYEFVTEQKIDDWFTAHPTINPDPKTVHFAAQEIQKAEDDIIEARVQARLKAKAEKAKEVELSAQSAPLAALPGDKDVIDRTPAEQEEIIRKDIERLQKQ